MTERCYPLDREWDELWERWPVDVPLLVSLPQISDEDWERMAAERQR